MSKITGWVDAVDLGQENNQEAYDPGFDAIRPDFERTYEDSSAGLQVLSQDIQVDSGADVESDSAIDPSLELSADTEEAIEKNTEMPDGNKFQAEIQRALEGFSESWGDSQSDISESDFDHILFMIENASHFETLDFYELEQQVYALQKLSYNEKNATWLDALVNLLRKKHFESLESENVEPK